MTHLLSIPPFCTALGSLGGCERQKRGINMKRSSVLVSAGAAFAMVLWVAAPVGAASVTTELVTRSSGGSIANGDSFPEVQSINSNGQFVAFDSSASNLVTGDTNDR